MNLTNDPSELDSLIRRALSSLYEELAVCDWYVREHEVVNLFVSGHLLSTRDLDPRQVAIEGPVLKVLETDGEKLGVRKDVVVWRTPNTTLWKSCPTNERLNNDARLRFGSRPYAIIEWKNISGVTKGPSRVLREHAGDIRWLITNTKAGMMVVGFAVLVDQSHRPVITATKIVAGVASPFMTLPQAAAATP